MTHKKSFFSSIKFKTMMGIGLLILMIMTGVIGIISEQVRKTVMDESLDKGRAIARNLSMIAEEAILTQDDTSLFVPLSKSVKESKGIVYAFVRSNQNKIIAHNEISEVDATYSLPGERNNLRSDGKVTVISYLRNDGLFVYDISTAIGGAAKLGFVHIGIDGSTIDEVVKSIRNQILLMTLVGLIVAAIGAFIVASMQVKPILLLVDGVRAIGEGHLDQKIDIKRKDEIGDLTNAFNDMAKGLQEREFIRQTFRKFVHKDLADQLLNNPDMIKVGGERKKATIIFTDIRGFTPLSETLQPEELINLLNSYFGELVPIIDKHGGILDKFIGDAMMIVFGTPVESDDDSLNAVKAGLEMKETIERLNKQNEKEGKKTIIMGIGINTGHVVAGNLGTEDRMEYTVLGDAVNVAARIEGVSRKGEVLISEATYEEIKDKINVSGDVEHVELKGKSKPMGVYHVVSVKEETAS